MQQELFIEHKIIPVYYIPLPEGYSKCFICTNIDITQNGNYLGVHQYDNLKWFCFNCTMQPLIILARIRKNNETALNEFLTEMEKAMTDAIKEKVRNTYRKSYNNNCGMWKTFLETCRSIYVEPIEQPEPTIQLYQNQYLNQWFSFP